MAASTRASTSGVKRGRTSRAPKLSTTWLALLAPVMTVLTWGFDAHQAMASWAIVQPRSSAIGRSLSTFASDSSSVRRSASHS